MDFFTSLYLRFPTDQNDCRNLVGFTLPIVNHFVYTRSATEIVSACKKNCITGEEYESHDLKKAKPFRDLFYRTSGLYKLGALVQFLAAGVFIKLAGLSHRNILLATVVCANGLYSFLRSRKSIENISTEFFQSKEEYSERITKSKSRFAGYLTMQMYDEAFELLENVFKHDEKLLKEHVFSLATQLALHGNKDKIKELERKWIDFQKEIDWIFLKQCLEHNFKMAEDLVKERRQTLEQAVEMTVENETDRQMKYGVLANAFIKQTKFAEALEVVKKMPNESKLCKLIQDETTTSHPKISQEAKRLLSTRTFDLT